jgi:hypothetical protein
MKRLIMAVIALTSAITISFVGFFCVNHTCNRLEDELVKLSDYANENQTEKAIQKSEELIVLWDEIHGRIESFIDHDETDKLEEIIRNLPIYARQGNMDRLEQQIDLAIDEIGQIIRSEKPIMSNIF